MTNKKATTLLKHRKNLAANSNAYTADIQRCYKSVVKYLKAAGYSKLTFKRESELITSYVNLIFKAQNSKPFFHIDADSKLPFCWNSPAKGGWSVNYIKYEWGHLNSKNQNAKTYHSITNLCLQSARCNQHIQSAMNVDELIAYGGKLASVIEENLKNRDDLFKSKEWRDLCLKLKKLKKLKDP